MYHLHLALPDLVVADPDSVAGSLARLPVLEGLLARSDRRRVEPDWRRWALSLAGARAAAGDLPVARTLAGHAGLDLAAAATWFVATPVRLLPGLASVHFDPAGPVALAPGGAAALAARAAAGFGDPRVALSAIGSTLLLSATDPYAVHTRDPAALAGLGLDEGRPTGADAGRLERLMTELQMWLHERPLAGADGRAANALWLWGAGAERLAPAGPWPVLGCDDPFLAAASAGAPSDPSRLLEACAVADLVRRGESFAAADEHWFAPLAARLRDGEIGDAQLHCGGVLHVLARGQRLRVWRRTRPWWEQLR